MLFGEATPLTFRGWIYGCKTHFKSIIRQTMNDLNVILKKLEDNVADGPENLETDKLDQNLEDLNSILEKEQTYLKEDQKKVR